MSCTLCSGYLALKNEVRSRGIKMSYCKGCRPRNKNCAFLKKRGQKLSNGEVSFCFECSNFPCERLRKIDARYRAWYRMSMIENSNFIKENGIDRFLEDQERRWKCPNCVEMVCCHNGICFNCGLEKLITNLGTSLQLFHCASAFECNLNTRPLGVSYNFT